MGRRQTVGKAVGLFVLVLVATYLGRPYPPGPGNHWSNLERIADRMSRAEAVAVIGLRPQSEQPGQPDEPVIVSLTPPDGAREYHGRGVVGWCDRGPDGIPTAGIQLVCELTPRHAVALAR
jgi:hypothetical protein